MTGIVPLRDMANAIRLLAMDAVEAVSACRRNRYVEAAADGLGMATFGASAPANEVYNYFGIIADSMVRMARSRLDESRA